MNNNDDVVLFADALAPVIREYFEVNFRPLADRLAELEKTAAELKAQPTLRYIGTWQPASYKHGTAATWAGSLWVAMRDTTSKPGTDDAWQLAVKRGRDGKDATA